MDTFYVRNFVEYIMKKKKVFFISIIFFAILLGIIGYLNTSNEITEEQLQEIQEYEETLEEYESVLAEVESSIETAQQEVDALTEYCENSIYMQLDANEIQVSSVQYAVKADSGLTNIMTSLISYINDGSLKESLTEKLEDVPAEYLKEIISCSYSSNILNVVVMHYDSDQAELIADAISECLEAQQTQIAAVQGEFTLTLLDKTNYTKADSTVLSTQNSSLTSLKTLKSNLADQEKKLIDQQTNMKNYKENYEPDETTEENPVKNALKYAIFGIILGMAIPGLLYALRYFLSDRIKEKGDLLAANVAVFGCLDPSKDCSEKIERGVMDIQILSEKEKTKRIFINSLGQDEKFQTVVTGLADHLKKYDFEVACGDAVQDDTTQLKTMMETGNCILIAEIGKTTFTQLEDQLQLCRKFGVSVWGCFVLG